MKWILNKRNVQLPGRFYVIQFGDSLYSISQKFNISIDELLAWNEQIDDSHTLFPGEILWIPVRRKSERKSERKSVTRNKRKKRRKNRK